MRGTRGPPGPPGFLSQVRPDPREVRAEGPRVERYSEFPTMWLFRSSSKGRRIAPRGRIDEETDASTSPARASIAKRNEMSRRVSSSTTAEAPARSSGPRAPPTPEAVSPDLSRRLQALATLEVPPYEGEDDDEEERISARNASPPAVAQPAPAMQRSTTPPLALALRKGGGGPGEETSPLSREPSTRGGNLFFNLDAGHNRSGVNSAAISRGDSLHGGNAYTQSDRLVRHASFKDMSPLLAAASSDRGLSRSRGISRSGSAANLPLKSEP